MDKMKLRFTNAVASRLSAAPHSTAKTELVEELSDNLYRRYQDMVAGGMEDSAAFDQSLDELGDVDELLDYLKGLDPEEELPRLTLHPYEEQEKAKRDLDDLLSSVDEIVENAMDQAKDALRQARDAARQVRKSSWRSDDGSLEFHFNEPADKQDRAQAADTAAPGGSAVQADSPDHGKSWDVSIDNSDATGKKSWQLSFGYDKEKGGFFAESSSTLDASGGPIPSQGLRGVDVQTVNGDVTIHLLDGADDCIRLEGDVDQLEVKVTNKGVLAIRQGKTASSSFFFLRGLSSADVELYLPRRRWEFIQVSAVNGDVALDDGFDLERLSVKTTSGDLSGDFSACGRLYFKSASGDLRVSGLTGCAQAETMSGDIRLQGHMDQVSLCSMSGDVELAGSAEQVRLSSMSGDIRLETALLPDAMELSSKSGDCWARIPDVGPFTLRYKTTSGEFFSDFSLTRTSQGAVYGGGGTHTYTMTTVSGDIELRKY